MLTESMRLISVDDHVIEPPDVWTDRLPARFREVGPRIVEGDDGVQYWAYEDKRTPITFQGNAHTRKFRDGTGGGTDLYARRYDDMIPAAYDVHERVAAMDRDGVHAELLFPTYPRFAGTRFLEFSDRSLALACVQAWNDWMIDDWCATYPERFIPQVLLPLWDIPACVDELNRTAAKGARSVAFCENPAAVGLESFPSGAWSPVFAAAEEAEVVLSMHIGTSGRLPEASPGGLQSIGIALCGINSMLTLGELTMTDAVTAHPKLKLALSEGGAGWVPYALERLDYTWERSRYEGVQQTMPPSEIFRRNFWTCFIADEVALELRERIGVDKLMWEADFPHNDSNYPHSRERLAEACRNVPDDDVRAIVETNAADLYRFKV